MRVLGSLFDVFNLVFKRNGYDVTVTPNASTTFTAARTFSLPNRNEATTLAMIDAAQTFAGAQTCSTSIASPSHIITSAGGGSTTVTRTSSATNYTLATQDRSGYVADLQNIQDAAADKPSYYFDGTGDVVLTTGAAVSNIGTSDLTLIISAKCANTTTAGTARYLGRALVSGSAELGILQKSGSTLFQVSNYAGSVDTALSIPGANLPFTFAVKRYSTNKFMAFLDGISDIERTLTFDTLTNAAFGISNATSTYGWLGEVSRYLAFNYALTADKIARYSAGAKLDWEDVGGSMSDISSAATWTNLNLTDFTSSGNDIATYTAGSNGLSANLATTPVVAGKTYRVSYTHTGTAAVMAIAFIDTGLTLVRSNAVFLVNGTSYADLVVTITDATAKLTFQRSNAGTSSAGALTILSVVQLGCVLGLEPEGIGEGTWQDSSTNKLHGTVTNALAQYPSQNDPATTWLPAITAGTNVAAVGTASGAKYRVANGICHFEFNATIDVTAAGPTASTVTFTLPIAAKTTNINGVISSATNIGRITAVAAAATASWYCTNDTANVAHVISGSYFI